MLRPIAARQAKFQGCRELARPPRAGRYVAPVIGDASRSEHLATACGLAAHGGGRVVAVVIGKVPRSLPMGADAPELWSRLEYEAARARRLGRELGQEVETVLALSDSAGAAIVQLAEELGASAVCLAEEPGVLATLRRWWDPLWRTVLSEAPCPVVIQRLRPADRPARGHNIF